MFPKKKGDEVSSSSIYMSSKDLYICSQKKEKKNGDEVSSRSIYMSSKVLYVYMFSKVLYVCSQKKEKKGDEVSSSSIYMSSKVLYMSPKKKGEKKEMRSVQVLYTCSQKFYVYVP